MYYIVVFGVLCNNHLSNTQHIWWWFTWQRKGLLDANSNNNHQRALLQVPIMRFPAQVSRPSKHWRCKGYAAAVKGWWWWRKSRGKSCSWLVETPFHAPHHHSIQYLPDSTQPGWVTLYWNHNRTEEEEEEEKISRYTGERIERGRIRGCISNRFTRFHFN